VDPTPCAWFQNYDPISPVDAPINNEQKGDHLAGGGVSKSHHDIIQNAKTHWFKYHNDLVFEHLAHITKCFESVIILFPLTACRIDLMQC
jgi:hypothetical protein